MAAHIVSYVAQWIRTQLSNEAEFLAGVKDQVTSIQFELKHIQMYLEDSYQQEQFLEKREVQLSLFTQRIREIAFDTEDVIDTYILQAASRSHFPRLIPKWVRNSPVIHDVKMKLDEINEDMMKALKRLKSFEDQHTEDHEDDPVGLKNDIEHPVQEVEDTHTSRNVKNQLAPGRLYMVEDQHTEDHEDGLVGLEDQIEDLVQKVAPQNEEDNKGAWVVSIVGQGGIGKTTLARSIYNDARVRNHYNQVVAWVYVTQQWKPNDLLLSILKQMIKGIDDEEKILNTAVSHSKFGETLKKFLDKKRNLVVLDDMWTTEVWDKVSVALPLTEGSKVIITTRNKHLPNYVHREGLTHKLRPLEEGDCWKLLNKIAGGVKEPGSQQRYESLGRQMIDRREQLPLAIVTLGGLLRTKHGKNDWDQVKERLISSKARSPMISSEARSPSSHARLFYEVITLSYHDLPYYLKPCFLYLAVFSEYSEIPGGMLTRLWIAEGFVTNDLLQGGHSLEDVAEWFLEVLIRRRMVQVVERNHAGKVKSCRVHDLVRDFCILKAKEQSFLETNQTTVTTSASRHLRRATPDNSSLPTQHSYLRSFIRLAEFDVSTKDYRYPSILVELNFKQVHRSYKLLRVLNLWGIQTRDRTLPKQIGKLIFLRYLGLLASNIKCLPPSIGNLRNLLVLDYRWVIDDGSTNERLPNVEWKMERLRHLYLPWCKMHSKSELHTLKNLQTLWGMNVGNWRGNDINKLSPSLRKLSINGISSKEQLEAVLQCRSVRSGHLRNLGLAWEGGAVMMNIGALYYCNHLTKLHLDGKIKIDKELNLKFPPNLRQLVLKKSSIGQPNLLSALGKLRSLKILVLDDAYTGTELTCPPSIFQKLEELSLCRLSNLENCIIQDDAMPALKKLQICDCPKLRNLRKGPNVKLKQLQIEHMPRNFCEVIERDFPINKNETSIRVIPDDPSRNQH